MIVIFPLLVSKNVNTNIVQGMAIVLEQYIASYAISDFVGKSKEFNKFYQYKIKGGKIYQESESTWFDIDPLTRGILDEHMLQLEIKGGRKNKQRKMRQNQSSSESTQFGKKGVPGSAKSPDMDSDPTKNFPSRADIAQGYADQREKEKKEKSKKISGMLGAAQQIDKVLKDFKNNKNEKGQPVVKPGFSKATISSAMLNLEPTWVIVNSQKDGEQRLGIKVVPMMIEGFNVKHTLSMDMQKYFMNSFITGIGRKVMRLVYRLLDRWTAYGSRPRGDIRHDLFYARTGHDGQPFVLIDKNEDIPKLFFSQPQNILKLWKMSWGNMLIADEYTKTVMFCMKKYKGMCSNFTYSMLFAQSKEMGKVFEDMEDARKATGALFKMNKKITSLGGK